MEREFDVVVRGARPDGERSPHAAWTYRHPYPWIRKIKNHIAFWNGIQVVPD